jgi:hypothetical protein
MWVALRFGYWITLVAAVSAAGFLVTSLSAFFRHHPANDWVGRVIGVLTLTPTKRGGEAMPSIMRVQVIWHPHRALP